MKYIVEFEDKPCTYEDEVHFYKCIQAPWWGLSERVIEQLTPYQPEPDCVSRQEAIDCVTYDVEHTIECLKALPSAQPEQRWIPCSERLPSHDEYIKNNGLFIVSDGNRSYSEWYDIYDKRKFGEPTMSGFRIDYAVTAWMPLPEPYRGGEK